MLSETQLKYLCSFETQSKNIILLLSLINTISSIEDDFPRFDFLFTTILKLLTHASKMNFSILMDTLEFYLDSYFNAILLETKYENIYIVEKTVLTLQKNLDKGIFVNILLRSWRMFLNNSLWTHIDASLHEILSLLICRILDLIAYCTIAEQNRNFNELLFKTVKIGFEWLERVYDEKAGKKEGNRLSELFNKLLKKNENIEKNKFIFKIQTCITILLKNKFDEKNVKEEFLNFLLQKIRIWGNKEGENQDFLAAFVWLIWNDITK